MMYICHTAVHAACFARVLYVALRPLLYLQVQAEHVKARCHFCVCPLLTPEEAPTQSHSHKTLPVRTSEDCMNRYVLLW